MQRRPVGATAGVDGSPGGPQTEGSSRDEQSFYEPRKELALALRSVTRSRAGLLSLLTLALFLCVAFFSHSSLPPAGSNSPNNFRPGSLPRLRGGFPARRIGGLPDWEKNSLDDFAADGAPNSVAGPEGVPMAPGQAFAFGGGARAGPNADATNLVRGVVPEGQERYAKQREAGHFECLDGSQSFPSFGVVNDDYCDCKDGSDEPGTAACAGVTMPGKAPAGFACGWALPAGGVARDRDAARSAVIRSGAVNDGICDCCGGEDEWDGGTVCRDRCAEIAALEKAKASRALAGSRARERYVQRAAGLRAAGKYKGVDGGPDDVFIAAADAGCLELDDGEYVYEVCLFNKAKQKDRHNGQSFSLGKKGKWATTLWENGEHRKDYSKLIIDDGEYCWASKAPRRAEVTFECAETPKFLSAQEIQVCVYGFHLQTPAACHPLRADH